MALTIIQKASYYFLRNQLICDPVTREFLIDMWEMSNRNNFGVDTLVEGDRRTGKTMTVIAVAEILDPTFNIHTVIQRIHWRTSKTIKAIRNSKKGQAIIFEEAGVDANSRDWQKTGNKNLSKVMQIKGFKNSILLATVPRKGMVDSQVREMFNIHCIIERHGSKPPKVQFYYPKYFSTKGKTFPTSPKILILDEKQIYSLKQITWQLRASPGIVKAYLKLEKQEKDKVMTRMEEEAIKDEQKIYEEEYAELEKIASEILQEILEEAKQGIVSHWFNQRGNINWKLIAVKYKMGRPKAQGVQTKVEYDLSRLNRKMQEDKLKQETDTNIQKTHTPPI